MDKQSKRIHRADYSAPCWRIPTVALDFDIQENLVVITADLRVVRVGDTVPPLPLILDGKELTLRAISADGRALAPSEYEVDAKRLTLHQPPSSDFLLQTVVEIDPYNDTSLEGLYLSAGILCTQNEAEGFRRITYFIDRPDILSVYSTTITADKKCFLCLLSNGNLQSTIDLPDDRQRVVWHDPFPKPCYLFALVAGDLGMIQNAFTTKSGRDIDLRIYVDPGNEDRAWHAMRSLQKSMRWDEQRFGLEYDLDLYMIVAVDAFNAGAMENKGLNIFNSVYVLASPKTATDTDFLNVERVVAHEYFHNWTGNRVTLRDWFQLTLKEGLTVFRDTEFSSDVGSRPLRRIETVRGLRNSQFAEDAGPNAHSIRPESYTAIDNFYTSTVYEKGAEVIRMLQTLLGHDGFRRGMDLYFERHDGSAVTCEDFLQAMEQANDVSFPQFRRWYSQAGTPEVEATGDYDLEARVYTLQVVQSCAPTSDGSPKEPFLIPMTLGLLGRDGHKLRTALRPGCVESRVVDGELVCLLAKAEHELVFEDVPELPVPSLFRSFSAPMKVRFDYSDADLRLLMSQDSDPFNRYDAGQRLLTTALGEMIETLRDDESPSVSRDLLDAFDTLLDETAGDCAFRDCALALPTVGELNQEREVCDFANAEAARRLLLKAFADHATARLLNLYHGLHDAEHTMDQEAMGRRALRARCLHILSHREDGAEALAREQFGSAVCMTETIAALEVLCRNDTPGRELALTEFRDRWQSDFNVMNKWFTLQAGAPLDRAYADVELLVADELFDLANPNRVRSVYGAFARNLPSFHHESGRGYAMIADLILRLDGMNAHMAAGLAKCFKDYARLDEVRKPLLDTQLERIAGQVTLSAGTREIVENIRSHA